MFEKILSYFWPSNQETPGYLVFAFFINRFLGVKPFRDGLCIKEPNTKFCRTFTLDVEFPTRKLNEVGDTFYVSEPQEIAGLPW